jgi:hypothetical protein
VTGNFPQEQGIHFTSIQTLVKQSQVLSVAVGDFIARIIIKQPIDRVFLKMLTLNIL